MLGAVKLRLRCPQKGYHLSGAIFLVERDTANRETWELLDYTTTPYSERVMDLPHTTAGAHLVGVLKIKDQGAVGFHEKLSSYVALEVEK